jgi:hypothetical protein
VRDLVLMTKARAAFDALAPSGASRRALAGVIAELADDRVPLVRPDDISLSHGPAIMGRRVPGTDLVVGYVPAGEHVFVVNIRRQPA